MDVILSKFTNSNKEILLSQQKYDEKFKSQNKMTSASLQEDFQEVKHRIKAVENDIQEVKRDIRAVKLCLGSYNTKGTREEFLGQAPNDLQEYINAYLRFSENQLQNQLDKLQNQLDQLQKEKLMLLEQQNRGKHYYIYVYIFMIQ